MGQPPISLCKPFLEELDPEKLRKTFLNSLLKLQNVQRGSIWIKDGDVYRCIEATGKQSERIKNVTIGQDQKSIVGWVIENGKMAVAEAGKDSRHYKELEEALAVKSAYILCFPLFLKSGEVYGAVEIIDVEPGGKKIRLEKDYLELLQSVVDIGSIALGNSLSYTDQVMENERLKRVLGDALREGTPIGQSRAFLKVMELARHYAGTDFPVLVTGESGTGKEVVAAEIHRLSRRAGKPFLIQNCSAIPETLLESELFGYKKGAFTGADQDRMGLFEAASGGTVFLDEIGDMPLNLQARILRVIQNGEVKPLGETRVKRVDVRLISATNKDLAGAVNGKEFRSDLYYRLSVLPLHVPPLRERKEDIPLLLKHFIRQEAARMSVSAKKIGPDAMARLTAYSWPGNVRELENFVKYMLVIAEGETITLEDLPEQYKSSEALDSCRPPREAASAPGENGRASSQQAVSEERDSNRALFFKDYSSWEELEKAYVLFLLEENRWNITRAAEDASVNRSTFVSRMRRLGIRK